MTAKIDTQAPERIWITSERSLWPTHRSFTASDLDHSNDDGTSDYQEYVRADLVPAPAVPDDVAKVCANCGSSMTDAELEAWRAEDPVRRSCCPERKMVPLTREEYDEYRDHCKSQSATIEAQAAELARLREENAIMAASLDEEERKHGLSTNGNMWRFWSQQLREYHDRRAKERAALTQPTGGSND